MKIRPNKTFRLVACVMLTLMMSVAMKPAQAAEHRLSFAVSGVVVSVNVRSGQNVKTGDVLAVMDQTPFLARKRAADAAAKTAMLVLDLAEVKVNQVRELFDALSTSQEEVDKAETAFANAQSGYEAAAAKAKIREWKLQRATLRASFAGKVTAVPGYAGMVVNVRAGGKTVVVVNSK